MKWSSFTILYVPLGQWARYFSFAMLVLGTIIFTLSVFSHFTPRPQKSLYERVSEDREKLLVSYEKLRSSPHPEDKKQAEFQSKTLCALTGSLCNSNPRVINDKDVSGSFVGKLLSLYTFPLMNMPSSGVGTIQSTIAKIGLVPETLAADGSGFGGLAPYSFIWEQIRNVTYIILVLVVLFSGFFIMFRSAVSANVSITMESLLPKIIVTMILIQLSFAISGFLIDVMYVASAFVVGIFAPLVMPDQPWSETINQYLFATPFGVVRGLLGPNGVISGTWMIMYTIPDYLMSMFGGVVRTLFFVFSMFIANTVVKPALQPEDNKTHFMDSVTALTTQGLVILKAFLTGGVGGALKEGLVIIATFFADYWLVILFAFFPQFVIGFILLVTLLNAAWKILKMMFMAYVRIIIYTIFAPFLLLLGLMPGKSGFGSWVSSMLYELSVYPIFIAISMFSFLILGYETSGIGLRLPYLTGIEPQAFSYLIGISILAMSPNLIDRFRKSVFSSGIDLVGDAKDAFMQGLGLIKSPPKLLTSLPTKYGARFSNQINRISKSYSAANDRIRGQKSKEEQLMDSIKMLTEDKKSKPIT